MTKHKPFCHGAPTDFRYALGGARMPSGPACFLRLFCPFLNIVAVARNLPLRRQDLLRMAGGAVLGRPQCCSAACLQAGWAWWARMPLRASPPPPICPSLAARSRAGGQRAQTLRPLVLQPLQAAPRRRCLAPARTHVSTCQLILRLMKPFVQLHAQLSALQHLLPVLCEFLRMAALHTPFRSSYLTLATTAWAWIPSSQLYKVT